MEFSVEMFEMGPHPYVPGVIPLLPIEKYNWMIFAQTLDKSIGSLIAAEMYFRAGGHSLDGEALAKRTFNHCYTDLQKVIDSIEKILRTYYLKYVFENKSLLYNMIQASPSDPIIQFSTAFNFSRASNVGFVTDGEKFLRAYNNILQSKEQLQDSKVLAIECIYPEGVVKKYDCVEIIGKVISTIKILIKQVEEAKERLLSIDSTFKMQYTRSKGMVEEDFPNLGDKNLDFTELNDYQNTNFGLLSYYFSVNVKQFKKSVGKTLGEALETGELPKSCEFIKYAGLGNFKIKEVITDEYGCNILILIDEMGNYTMVFPPTHAPTSDPLANDPANYDTWYDAYPLLEEMGLVDFWKRNTTNISYFLNSLKNTNKFLGDKEEEKKYSDLYKILLKSKDGQSLISAVEEIYYGQRNTVVKTVERYVKNAAESGNQINFYGYSKGGGLAELAYLTAYNNRSLAKHDVLGDVVVHNPFHDNLTSDEVKILENSGDLTVYRNQGDYVSCLFNEHDFDDQTIFIKCNWRNSYNTEVNKNESLSSILKYFSKISVLPENVDSILNVGLNAFKLASVLENGSPHSLQVPLDAGVFKDDGTAIKADVYYSKDVSKILFGNSLTPTDMMESVSDLADSSVINQMLMSNSARGLTIAGIETWQFAANTIEEGRAFIEWGVDRCRDAADMVMQFGEASWDALCDFGDWITFWD